MFKTLLGYLISLGIIAYAIIVSGAPLHSFVDVPAILLVIVGTCVVTATSFPLTDIVRGLVACLQTLDDSLPAAGTEAARLVKISQRARQQGLLAMQKEVAAERVDFLRQGLSLAVDGAPPELIERVLATDTATQLARQQVGLHVLKRAAEVAPAMGLIGTLIGLVQMLGNLSDPDKIGPSMAIAILTTLYGAILAYMIFSPLAGKLERTSAAELLLRKLYATATLAIAKQENPRQLELHLNAILPPAQRLPIR